MEAQQERTRTGRRFVTRRMGGALLALMLAMPQGVVATGEPVTPEAPTGVEDGGIKQHTDFEFEAFIKHDDVKDGTAPFDANNDPGNDQNDRNKIVRSFDTVMYPLKVTINPKNVDKLENIVLRMSGTLEGGITNKRVNAKFGVGGKEDMATETVSFVQEYTVKQTGNSVMIPIAIETQGAEPGVVLTPDITVEVVSIGGKTIDGSSVKTTFTNLPDVQVSARVNIKPIVNTGLAGQGIPYFPLAGITRDASELRNTHALSVAWGVERLPGKTDMRGATFPDPRGVINYRLDMSGRVAYDALPVRNDIVPFDFSGKDEPFLVYDQQPINATSLKVGARNTVMEGKSYNYRYPRNYSAPQSQITPLTPEQVAKYGHHMVWGSGTWELGAPDIQQRVVTYRGTNTGYIIGSTFPFYRSDGYTGSALYGVNERVFATNSFLVLMANEYAIGAKNNPDGLANNAFYRASVVLESYTDENGNVTPYNKTAAIEFGERNNPAGAFSVQNTLKERPSGKELGTPNVGWSTVSKGDASTLIGQDVFYDKSLVQSIPTYGGYKGVFRWNTDSFELTKADALDAEARMWATGYFNVMIDRVTNDKVNQRFYYGIQKFPRSDNEFSRFTQKGIDDYTWYASYDEAATHGRVGAMQTDVGVPAGPSSHQAQGYIPLKVRHDNIGIGSMSKQGSANIIVTNYYPFLDAGRTRRIDVSANRSYHNPAIWDENGVMLERQSPRGSTINFETLGVQPAIITSVIDSDKLSYYNSETIKWTVKNSSVLPQSGVPENFDASARLVQTLPRGLTYKVGSGQLGGRVREPELTRNSDGTTTLTWDVLIAPNGAIETATFETTINPFALGAGVQSSLVMTNRVDSDLDMRPQHLRTSTKTVTILKVGMVGIFESIDKLHGDKDSAYKLTLSPYTTIEDEREVTGLTTIPLPGDRYGSQYSGENVIQSIDVVADRKHDDDVVIYLNRDVVHHTHPNKIDVSTGGWYRYEDADDLVGAKSLLFKVDGLMTNTDAIRVDVTLKTQDNAFGDMYLNETVINSATDYRLSPISNRVRYLIRADVELGLERLRIYTDTREKGLTSSVRIKKLVLDGSRVAEEPITIGVYDKATGQKVTDYTVKQSALQREVGVNIPVPGLSKGDVRQYEFRLEGVNEDRIWVKDGEGVIDTEGVVALEPTLTDANRRADGTIRFTGVTMTERELGRDIVRYSETLELKKLPEPTVKSGYGFAFEPQMSYSNPILADVSNRIGIRTTSPGVVLLDKMLVDTTLAYYDETTPLNKVSLVLNDATNDGTVVAPNTVSTRFAPEEVLIERETGNMYTAAQAATMSTELLPAGNRLFVPVWVERVGDFPLRFQTADGIGSHRVQFDTSTTLRVPGYMFSHTDSETPDADELLLRPADGETDLFD